MEVETFCCKDFFIIDYFQNLMNLSHHEWLN